MVDNSKRARFEVFLGASDSGKSTELQRRLRMYKPKRAIYWDHKSEYTNIHRVHSMAELFDYVTTKDKKPKQSFKVRFVPGRLDKKAKWKAFSSICSMAMHIKDVTVVCEEAQFVTNPNGGPPGYLEAVSTGRASGVSLLVSTQRPARIDKDIFANSSYIWCGRLGWDDDVVTMRKVLRVPAEELLTLNAHESIARDMRTGDIYRNGKKLQKK